MGNKKIPYLCGGTLFFLLVQTKKPRANARERDRGVKDHLSDPEMMEGLIQAITGSYTHANGGSLKKDTSQFRECRIDGSTSIPINEQAVIGSYDYDVRNNYGTALLRMLKFAEDFLDPEKTAWLVRVLLDVIEQDSGIKEDAHFYVQRDGTFLSKADVLSTTHFQFQPFLVGIVHYILMNRGDNLSGQDTLEAWGIKVSERSERRLQKEFSLGTSRTVDVDWRTPNVAADAGDNVEAADGPDDNTEYIDAEVVDGEGPSGAAEGNKKTTVIQQQINVIQNGEKNFNLTNNGTMNFNF